MNSDGDQIARRALEAARKAANYWSRRWHLPRALVQEAADAAGEAIGLALAKGRFDPAKEGGATVETWAAKKARWALLDLLRQPRYAGCIETDPVASCSGPGERASDLELRAAIRHCESELERRWPSIALRWRLHQERGPGVSLQQLSSVLGVALDTFKESVERALVHLRECLWRTGHAPAGWRPAADSLPPPAPNPPV